MRDWPDMEDIIWNLLVSQTMKIFINILIR